MRRHVRRVVKHGGWISVALATLVGVRVGVPQTMLRAAIDVGGNFLQTFGGIYGIIVAFAIYVTWGEHNDTQVAIEKEAVSLIELHRYALAVPKAHTANAPPSDVDEHAMLDKSLAAFLAHAPATPAEERIFPHALSLFHELNEAREHRVTVSNLKLPEGLRWFVFIGGAICIATLELLWVDSFVVHALLVAGMTWVVVAAASITLDLDDPYNGDFVVDWARFHKTAMLMEQTECHPG